MIVSLIVFLIVIGIAFYLFNTYIMPALPLAPPLKTALMALLALLVILWLLNYAGIYRF